MKSKSMLKNLKLPKSQNSKSSYEDRVGLVYARVSSKRQESEGSGLQSQEGRCRKDLLSIGVPFEKAFPDSFSGGGDFMKRPAMRALLDYIDDHPHKKFVVIFDDLSRFARDVVFHIKLRAEFRARDVVLRCLNYNFDESEEGEFVELIFAGKAELDRKQNRRQVIQKQKARLEAGYWAFGSKKGYNMIKDPQHGKVLVPNREGLEMLKFALEGFANGTFVRKIDACQFLVEKGFWKRQHASAYIDKFSFILKDPAHVGDIEYLPWGVTRRKGHHNGIISEETYNQIQQRLGGKGLTHRIRKDTSEDFPFRGLLLCSSCGRHLTGAWANGRNKKYAYYFCQNGLCELHDKNIPRQDIEDNFKVLLEKNKLKPEIEALVSVVFDKVWKEEVVEIKIQEENLEKRKKDLQEKINQLSEMAFEAKSNKVRQVYEKQIEEKVGELELIEVLPLEKLDTSIPYRTALNKAVGLVKSPYSIWSGMKSLEKHQLFYFIFDEKLEYSKKEGYRTGKLPYAVRLFEEFATSEPLDVEKGGFEPPCK